MRLYVCVWSFVFFMGIFAICCVKYYFYFFIFLLDIRCCNYYCRCCWFLFQQFVSIFFYYLLLLLYLFSQSVSLYYSIILHLCRIKFVAYVHNTDYKWQSFVEVYSLRQLFAKVCVLFRMLCFISAKRKSISFSDGFSSKYNNRRIIFFLRRLEDIKRVEVFDIKYKQSRFNSSKYVTT